MQKLTLIISQCEGLEYPPPFYEYVPNTLLYKYINGVPLQSAIVFWRVLNSFWTDRMEIFEQACITHSEFIEKQVIVNN